MEIRIGTSGWHYKHWIGTYYEAKQPQKMLARYVQDFDTVEINNSFYHLPSARALKEWRASTPHDFRFAAKASRFLTHMKKLNNAEQGLERYLSCIELLGDKLGPVLFQLPPNWQVNVQRLSEFLQLLPASHRYAFEFRNETWNSAEVLELLRRHRVAVCIHHIAGYESPLSITTDFGYIRLHGPGGNYQGCYSDEELGVWARRILGWSSDLAAVYVYFDNDDSGYAPRNALRLRSLLTAGSQ